jgi:hypothetical protein
MPKPTVQNTPKPELPTRKSAAKRPTPVVKKAAVTHQTPTQLWKAEPDAMEELCSHISSGGHLAGFCKLRGFAYNTVADWIYGDSQRAAMYARAREDRADVLADEMVSIADETEVITIIDEETGAVELKLDATAVARNRLRVDARKWVASKLKPRIYSDKVVQEHTGANGGPIQTTTMDLRGLSESELKQMESLLGKASSLELKK